MNFGRTRPTGLAYSADRGLLAIATRSGSIHMIEIDWRIRSQAPQPDRAATSPDAFTRH